jgi:hypothetical protein
MAIYAVFRFDPDSVVNAEAEAVKQTGVQSTSRCPPESLRQPAKAGGQTM